MRHDSDEAGPERTCVVTRRKAAPEAMIRFVLGPDYVVVPDIRRKLPGRGVWVTADAVTVSEAVRKKAFARGFKANVVTSPALAVETGALLEDDCLQSLSLANKAGLLTTGFAKVEAVIGKGTIVALVHAADGGVDGIRKLEAAVSRRFGERADTIRNINLFDSARLDLALGRTNVIHAALAAGAASEAFLSRCGRLLRYRSSPPPSAAPERAPAVDVVG